MPCVPCVGIARMGQQMSVPCGHFEGKSRRMLTPTQLFAASAAQPESSFEGIRAALDWSAGTKIVGFQDARREQPISAFPFVR